MIFFLDIDGVMVHANPHKKVELEADGFYKFNPVAVAILNAVIYKTKDEIILSSSHRYKYNEYQWKKIFTRRGIVLNHISILDKDKSSFNYRNSRRIEITEWIQTNNINCDNIVIIDDDKSLNDLPQHLKDRLILTNSYTGLNYINNFENLRSILKRKLKKNPFIKA
ncbi:HAD domain-containing protein [Sphingobacterium spiritivorum]|uniref:HAD domain-containing protein n=1 Tax=Sphingobacterium spiritivorum TaxID=258 RepID=UPI003DA299CC